MSVTGTNGGAFIPGSLSAVAAATGDFAGLLSLYNNVYYVNPASGSDNNDGLSQNTALQNVATAYAMCVSGNNDCVALVGNGATSATWRLSAGFTWEKSATHLVGLSSGVNLSNRSRVAPSSGATAFANLFTVSGSGCRFENVQFFHGFDTGTTAQICMTVTGGRNLFINSHLAGMGDAASAQNASSRSLKISGTGENQFVDCTIGIDTVTRTTTNASVEFASATPRNEFHNCVFPFMTSNAGVRGIYAAATGSMDRFQLFDRCLFINAVGSTSTTMTALTTLGASTGGILVLKDCTTVGMTDIFADATTAGQMWIDGAPPVTTTSAIAVNPA